MSDNHDFFDEDDSLPWADVDAARKNAALQRQHPAMIGKKSYLSRAKSCAKCDASPEELVWFYFESSNWAWENLCGRAGWMTVCDKCRVQVDFFLEVLN